MKRLLCGAVFAMGGACAGSFTQAQATACLDYNVTHSNCSGAFTGTLTSPGESLSFTDVASSSFGIMHVATTNSFTVTNDQAWSYGFVAFQDVLTINSASHNGQTGFIDLGYFVDGTVSATGASDAFNQVIMRVTSNTFQNWVDDFHTSTPGTTATHLFSFIYGQPFTLYFSMQATGGTVIDSGHGYNLVTPSGTVSGTSHVNFSNTFTLTQLTTLGSDGSTPVGDSTFNSDSGTTYTQSGVVPEPAMWIPVAGVIAVMLHRRLRKPQGVSPGFHADSSLN